MDSFERFIKLLILSTFLMLVCEIPYHIAAKTSQQTVIEDLVDIKEFKKLLRTKNNVLICFISSAKASSSIVKVFKEAASQIRGQGTMVLIDCSSESKKLCKKLKVTPNPYVLKHYKDGEFHKDYDRKETIASMLNFMRDPMGDLPWEEDSTAEDIIHIPDATSLTKFLRKEPGPIMVMFYAPWCGFCKQLKPEYTAAAMELKGHSVFAAIDVNRPQNAVVRTQYNITGFPTLLYYENGVRKFNYEGENNKDSLVAFMKSPSSAPAKPVETEWSDVESAVQHLTDDTFDQVLVDADSVLVMFYAPWCGHCKKMKPEYEKAAEHMERNNIPGVLAALDATKHKQVGQKFKVTGYPTVKYFRKGVFEFDVSVRDESKIVAFMKDPKQPPPPPPPELPWSEEPSEVVHLTTDTFKPFLKKKKHVLVMFYAPWCGHCKKAKPEFTGVADEFKEDSKIEFAAVDCTIQNAVCSAHEVRGYPTIKYFNYLNRTPPQDYNGGRTRADFSQFMRQWSNVAPNADQASAATETNSDSTTEDSWGLTDPTAILHLSETDFKDVIADHDSILVLFHANWCGHCKKLKQPYGSAAQQLKTAGTGGVLAAVDVTSNPDVADQQGIAGLPTMQYYRKGQLITTYTGPRTAQGILDFMKNPPTSPEPKMKEEL